MKNSKPEPCEGTYLTEEGDDGCPMNVHCPGCTSATKRIAELEDDHRHILDERLLHEKRLTALTAMRTLARELERWLRHARTLIKKYGIIHMDDRKSINVLLIKAGRELHEKP